MDGMNATIQVVTNGDPNGGLYNCADVTLMAGADGPDDGICSNATGVKIVKASVGGNANETEVSNSTSGGKSAAAEGVRAQFGGLVVALLVAGLFAL